MSKIYRSLLTQYGSQQLAHAIATRQQLNVTQMAVGDGNGQAVTPNASRTALVKECYRANVSAISIDPRNNRQVIFELTIPEQVGGFYIREMGIFDRHNKLIAYANCPDSFKPTLESGSGKVQIMRMILLVNSADAVTLKLDDSVIFATRGQLTPKYLNEMTTNAVDETGHTHQLSLASTSQKGIVQLSSALNSPSETLALTALAGKKLKDLIDAITRNLGNYIPNSKKSNAVNSNSGDTVATSSAVKLVYDKATEAKTIAETKYTAQDASTGQKGIVQLTTELNSTSETLGLTAFAGKKLKDLIDALTRNLGNYIPNSKKSNAVNSTSGDTVATSYAVKKAYDLAYSKQSPSTTLAGYGIADFKVTHLNVENLNDVMVYGLYSQAANEKALAERNYPKKEAGSLMVLPSPYGVMQVYLTYATNGIYIRNRKGHGFDGVKWRRVDIGAAGLGTSFLNVVEANFPEGDFNQLYGQSTTLTIGGGWRNGYREGSYGGILQLFSRKYPTGVSTVQQFFNDNKVNWRFGTQANNDTPPTFSDWYEPILVNLTNGKVEKGVTFARDIFINDKKVHHAGIPFVVATASNYGGLRIERPERNDVIQLEASHDDVYLTRRQFTEPYTIFTKMRFPKGEGRLHAYGDIVLLSGTANHGATLPLPAGFSETQCKFIVTMRDSNINRFRWDLHESTTELHYRTECYNNGRTVHALTHIYDDNSNVYRALSASVNYLVIGVK